MTVRVPDDILNLSQVAELFGVARPSVRYWIKKGELPAVQNEGSGEWEIKRSDAEALAAKRRERWQSPDTASSTEYEAPQTSTRKAPGNQMDKAR